VNLWLLCCNCTGPERITMQAVAARPLSLLLLVALGTLVRPASAGSNPAAGLPRKLAGTQAGINSTIADYRFRLPPPTAPLPYPVGVPAALAIRPGAYRPVTPPPAAAGPPPIQEAASTVAMSGAETTSVKGGRQGPGAAPIQAAVTTSRALLVRGDGCKWVTHWRKRNGTIPELVGEYICS
jgi:hypothetical protein